MTGMMKGGWLWANSYSFFLLVGCLLVHVDLGIAGSARADVGVALPDPWAPVLWSSDTSCHSEA